MQLSINLTEEQIERVFTHHGFAVIEREEVIERPIHGSMTWEVVERLKYVQNPMTLKLTPIRAAFNTLIERYIQSVLFGFTKSDIIDCLTEKKGVTNEFV